MPVLLMVGSFVSYIHLLPLQALVLQTIGKAASSKHLDTNLRWFSLSGMAPPEFESDSTKFDSRLVHKFNQTT